MSGDVMMFPDTVEEFMEQNKVVDREQVYSNGIEFVPIFRMQQWFDHVKHSPDDVRPVVFCKDCKFAVETKQPFGDDILLCTSIYNVRFVKDSFYCADGEKR